MGKSDARVVHYAVLSNHVHLIVEARDRVRLSRRVQGLEVRIARALNRRMGRPRGKVFADRYHAHILKTPREVRNALGYVLRNAPRHYPEQRPFARRGFVDAFSSAEWFDGWSIPIRTGGWSPLELRPPPISPGTTWLLTTGWKTRGRIDPREVS